MVLLAKMYFYDKKGRVKRISTGEFKHAERRAVDLLCRAYDDDDRLTLATNPISTEVCPTGDPNPRDVWREYKYAPGSAKDVVLVARTHAGNSDGTWTEKYQPFALGTGTGDVRGNADVDSKKGVTLIYGSTLGKLDENSANTVLDSFGQWPGSNYEFPTPPVSADVIENPNLLFRFDRRRYSLIDRGVRLYERFKPNEHLSAHRYYLFDNSVVRHEQLDTKGRVTRVITVNDWKQPRPGSNPAVNDKLLSSAGLKAHQVYHRVYEIDANGKPKLVALSWNKSSSLGLGKKVPIDFAHLAYGTPDGREKWKNKAEFEKAFNTSDRAVHIFPDGDAIHAGVLQ